MMKRAEHVACLRRSEMYTSLWWGNTKEEYHLKNLVLNGRIILKQNRMAWAGLI
jgi:hypothetical protein